MLSKVNIRASAAAILLAAAALIQQQAAPALAQQPAAPDTNWACALVGDTAPLIFCHAQGGLLNSSIQLTLPAFPGPGRVLLAGLNVGTYRALLCTTACDVDAQTILAAQPVADHDNSLYFEIPNSGVLQVFQTGGAPPPGALLAPTNLTVEVQ